MPDPRKLFWKLIFPFRGYGGGGGAGAGGSRVAGGMRSGEDKDLERFMSHSLFEGLNFSEASTPSESTESYDDRKHRDNLPRMPIVDLSVGSSAKTQALHRMDWRREKPQVINRMDSRREKPPKWPPGKSEHTLRLQRAWVVHSAWASIENVLKISSSVLVNKLQCEHIADHFRVIADVLKQLGLDKDFVSGEALKGGSGSQTNLTFNELHFSRVAETFNKKHFGERDLANFFVKTRIQDVSIMFQDYIRQLPALDGSSEESLSQQSQINKGFLGFSLARMRTKENVEARSRNRKARRLDNVSSTIEDGLLEPDWVLPTCESERLYHSNEESLSKQSNIIKGFQDFSLWEMSVKENVEARTRDRKQRSLDEFLCLLLGGLKQGEDLVLFHSRWKALTMGLFNRLVRMVKILSRSTSFFTIYSISMLVWNIVKAHNLQGVIYLVLIHVEPKRYSTI